MRDNDRSGVPRSVCQTFRSGGLTLFTCTCVCLFFRTPTLVTWGGVAGTGLIWFTDWKLVLQYVPYIGGKYKTED
ncbi:PREDICTED: cytochrome b-c1 complex subunit 10 [Aptenodytes forsteri]|nr:PREDICTED: cytochrome b-c1 complex subunit 10 [Aptenodytes forsteri]